MKVSDGKRRVAIEGVRPEIDCGRFPIKRTVGERVAVEADVFADGHDEISCHLRYRTETDPEWADLPMVPLGNDRWRGEFLIEEVVDHRYTIRAWIDRFGTWRHDLEKRVAAGQDVAADLLIGAEQVDRAARRASGKDARQLRSFTSLIRAGAGGVQGTAVDAALDEELLALMQRHPDRRGAVNYGRDLLVRVDREKARFSTWYELFPRSTASQRGRHGTFADVERRLPYVAAMGFDVLYFPPIHPIGTSFRKGPNNEPDGGPDAVGSPWAIGSKEGGHTAIHPRLGTIEDFEHLVGAAGAAGLEVALDLAFQCSPDHPWVTEHPNWFRHRPDGTIQYAENPPKKYQDIYPLDFETDDWQNLWKALVGIIRYWIDHGVKIFRVDNPHTKSFRFWEWAIDSIRADHPDAIFLSEAFTRPRIMYRLAKLGFNQSYTYFTWRNGKHELIEYLTELTATQVAEFFRPNFWPNTPDILHATLQAEARSTFIARFVLAGTLAASYGIYGPAFELMEHVPLEAGREEYLNSEKYEIRRWDVDRPDSLAGLVGRVNTIRHQSPALQSNRALRFHRIDNDQLIVYSKRTEDRSEVILVVVNIDPVWTQSGWLELDLGELGVEPSELYQVHDLLADTKYVWQGSHNYVELNPKVMPAHIFQVRRRVPTARGYAQFE
jgi:starch synthase (maltosyl-transferring)